VIVFISHRTVFIRVEESKEFSHGHFFASDSRPRFLNGRSRQGTGAHDLKPNK
jgi:hypothetical protein